jgi:hypothetical protein
LKSEKQCTQCTFFGCSHGQTLSLYHRLVSEPKAHQLPIGYEWNHERVPLDWAMNFGNQGVVTAAVPALAFNDSFATPRRWGRTHRLASTFPKDQKQEAREINVSDAKFVGLVASSRASSRLSQAANWGATPDSKHLASGTTYESQPRKHCGSSRWEETGRFVACAVAMTWPNC